ncbi:uncharacterized protein LOC133842680 [Drosophila sulfurigaster albostrigata]|uniref:uncharacterized protein LOC133842680 n=1 Tax=Drosophila sulfurigaster albostrigata TaxID=89887 RepID=UPI002D219042|nr:uncharacterized protein LOC133842680 [Drosophila sulfurigaster albostrigata]XP_062131864.1 uncharacterized protein LOC133842680 [Drosophila sulfurigaster albostrigata]
MVKLLEKAGCMQLRTAGICIGWLGVVGSVLFFICSVVVIANSGQNLDGMLKKTGFEQESHGTIKQFILLFAYIYMGASFLSCVASGLLIFGTMRDRHLMLLPWLTFSGLGVASSFINLLNAASGFLQSPKGGFDLCLASFTWVVQTYLYLVIYSLYKNIQTKNENGRDLVPSTEAAIPLQQNVPACGNYYKA